MYRFGFVTVRVILPTHRHHNLSLQLMREKGKILCMNCLNPACLMHGKKEIKNKLSPNTVLFELHIYFAVMKEDSFRAFKSVKTPSLVGVQLVQV